MCLANDQSWINRSCFLSSINKSGCLVSSPWCSPFIVVISSFNATTKENNEDNETAYETIQTRFCLRLTTAGKQINEFLETKPAQRAAAGRANSHSAALEQRLLLLNSAAGQQTTRVDGPYHVRECSSSSGLHGDPESRGWWCKLSF